MKLVIAVLCALAVCDGARMRQLVPAGVQPLTREMSQHINSMKTTWKVSAVA